MQSVIFKFLKIMYNVICFANKALNPLWAH